MITPSLQVYNICTCIHWKSLDQLSFIFHCLNIDKRKNTIYPSLAQYDHLCVFYSNRLPNSDKLTYLFAFLSFWTEWIAMSHFCPYTPKYGPGLKCLKNKAKKKDRNIYIYIWWDLERSFNQMSYLRYN